MNKQILNVLLFAFAFFGVVSICVQAQTGTTSRQVRTLLTRIETKTDAFRTTMTNAVDQGAVANSNREDRIANLLDQFETAIDELRRQSYTQNNLTTEVNNVLSRASAIDRFVMRSQPSVRAQNQWTSLKTDLTSLANYYNVTWNPDRSPFPGNSPTRGNTVPYNVSDFQLGTLLTQIETKTGVLKRQLTNATDRGRYDATKNTDNINAFVTELENSTARLKQRIEARQSTADDVNDLLTRASYVDRFMTRNQLSARAEGQWTSLKSDLNTLAGYYRVSWNWNRELPPYSTGGNQSGNFPGTSVDSRLTGTYRLNAALSDNVSTAIDRALGSVNNVQRDNVRQNLERRLRSPEMLAIEKVNNRVTLASSNSPQVSFDADGVARAEVNNRGRSVTTTAGVDRSGLSIRYEGERMNDFFVSFEPVSNNQLRVTRRVYLDNGTETIIVASVYDKIDSMARWSDVNSGGTVTGGATGGIDGTFAIPNGTRLTAVLQNMVSTRVSKSGDRFTMRVTSPSSYNDAIIEGHVASAESSGQLSGRAKMSLEFDSIRLADGRTYRFAGTVDSVRAANGDSVTVDNEGTVRDSNQTTKTATRAGIGAVLGALIGAVAGGGQGAAIGAGVGAGAGAGSVLIQGRDRIELEQGSEFSITAAAPANVGLYR